MADDPNAATLPSVEELCLRSPLYMGHEFGPGDAAPLATLRSKNFQFDAFCIGCKKPSTFRTERAQGGGAGMAPPPQGWMFSPSRFGAEVACQRDHSHKYYYLFEIKGGRLQKIGQTPSMEDIAGHDLQKFRGVLDKNDFSELHRAGGLASHGIGIGSFVYLRRIFERLIQKTRQQAEEQGRQLGDFDRLRMDEKIQALADFLPPALVKNKAIYGILSKGLHELDEQTCNKHFNVVRAAILQILEQELEAKNRKDAADRLEKEIAKISGSFGAKKDPGAAT